MTPNWLSARDVALVIQHTDAKTIKVIWLSKKSVAGQCGADKGRPAGTKKSNKILGKLHVSGKEMSLQRRRQFNC
jgi:hypothetical protein